MEAPATRSVNGGLLVLLSLVAAVTVGNLYLAQPLLAAIGRDLHAGSTAIGAVVTFSQIGYGTGVLFIVPLGDLIERRRLILTLLAAVLGFLLLASVSPSLPMLVGASLLIGVSTVIPQIVVPYAASLAADRDRAAVLGTVQGGLLLGILLARVFSGGIAAVVGWRGVFVVAAGLCGLLGVVVRWRLPLQPSTVRTSYGHALASMLTLLRREPVLRRTSVVAALNFAIFTSFWTTLPFLLESSFGKGPAAAGLFGLLGAVGAVVASLAGKLIDRKGTHFTLVAALIVTLASFGAFWFGARSLVWLAVGVAVMDAGVQATHLACQAEALSLDPAARSRINGVYMFLRFAGGAAGSALGSLCWARWGWTGFCVSGLAIAVTPFMYLPR
ncbi:MAG TPA: MFS transporter, partial [Polyangiaceae bacterium]|nr:MFS transporter [Polyangiaceae bacterium]